MAAAALEAAVCHRDYPAAQAVDRAAQPVAAHQTMPLVQRVKETKGGLEQPLKTVLAAAADLAVLEKTLLAQHRVMAVMA